MTHFPYKKPSPRNIIEFNSHEKVTVPEQSLSVREIIERQIVDPLNQDNMPSMTDETDALLGEYPSDYAEIPTNYELELIAEDYGRNKQNDKESSSGASSRAKDKSDGQEGGGVDIANSGTA